MIVRNPQASLYRTHAEVVELVYKFETCTLPRQLWNHPAHLTIAIWYLSQYPEPKATAQIRAGIQRYNQVQGIQTSTKGGYHETLTRFWIAIAQGFLTAADPNTSILERVNTFIGKYGVRQQLFLDYYSHERIVSREARQVWVEPDLKLINEE